MNRAVRFGRVLAGSLCLGSILLAAGCGGAKGEVSGKVLYQGKPVGGGTVAFISEAGGGVKTAPLEEDGSYTIRNMAAGNVKITVETASFRPRVMPQGGQMGGPSEKIMKYMKEKNPQMADPQRAKRYVSIPPQYSDPNKTNLTYTVTSGKQEHDIELK